MVRFRPAHNGLCDGSRPPRDRMEKMASEAKFLMAQFLEWVEARRRSVAEVRDAWSSTCPLNCAWEDALADDLVECCADGSIVVTARGRTRLKEPVQ